MSVKRADARPVKRKGPRSRALPATDALRAAKAALARGDLPEAERLCRALLAADPDHAEALTVLGIVAVKARRLELAMEVLPRAAALDPRNADAHTHLGATHLLLGRAQAALASVDRALALRAEDTLALNVRACALGSLGRHAESIEACDRALAVDPGFVPGHVNRGNACAQLGRLDDALASFEQALQIAPAMVEAVNNSANILKSLRRYDAALARYEQALALRPDYAEAAFNRGVTLGELGRPQEALESYRRALAIQPDHLDARYNLAHTHLQLGDFARGWDDGGAQRAKSLQAGSLRELPQPLWLGAERLNGKIVLLHAEAGLGDTLQFCRYAPRVAALGARVVLEVQRPLLGLLRGLEGVHAVVAKGMRLPKFDCHCPMMSLPAAFGTDLASVPADVPYLRADPARTARWRRRLGRRVRAPGLRIGLAWSGNPAHANDANRSIALSGLLSLLEISADWVSLQKEVRPRDAEVLAQRPDIRHFGEHLADFSDTAALLEDLDLVIAVDTSIAHLAGAMGKPLWLLLPFNPDWRWLLGRADSPWYPTARLFRQPAIGDWASVVEEVRDALTAFVRRTSG